MLGGRGRGSGSQNQPLRGRGQGDNSGSEQNDEKLFFNAPRGTCVNYNVSLLPLDPSSSHWFWLLIIPLDCSRSFSHRFSHLLFAENQMGKTMRKINYKARAQRFGIMREAEIVQGISGRPESSRRLGGRVVFAAKFNSSPPHPHTIPDRRLHLLFVRYLRTLQGVRSLLGAFQLVRNIL